MVCVLAGKLFSFELLDAQGGEIRGCGFNQCVDKFEPLMQQGAVIMLSKANLKNKRPNSVSRPFLLAAAQAKQEALYVRVCGMHFQQDYSRSQTYCEGYTTTATRRLQLSAGCAAFRV